jgi:hypothetical protein
MPVDFARQQNLPCVFLLGHDHVRRAQVPKIDRAIGEAFNNHGGGEGNDHLHGTA